MDLYIQRHAIAVERGTGSYKTDSQRPLTDKGAKKMHRIAKGMQALRLSFDGILSSPFVRAAPPMFRRDENPRSCQYSRNRG